MSEETIRAVLDAQTSDALRNDFISENRTYILGSACKAVGHYISEHDDEYSVALIAFNEAIDSYDESKGAFRPFAAVVIRRRLYDYIRTESRFSNEISLEPSALTGEISDDSPETSLHIEVRQREADISEQDTENRPEGSPVKDEIEAVQNLLSRYGFSFFDLTECSPKAGKTKEACAQAVAYLLQQEELIQKMRQSNTLPIKELQKATGISRKILERHRRYIIAAAEILNGDYPLLAEYMSYIKKSLGT